MKGSAPPQGTGALKGSGTPPWCLKQKGNVNLQGNVPYIGRALRLKYSHIIPSSIPSSTQQNKQHTNTTNIQK